MSDHDTSDPYWHGCHRVRILGPSRGRWGANCRDCSWTVGQHFASVEEARDRADGHRIFTHRTGGYLCGEPHCTACAAIRRIRAGQHIPDQLRPTPLDRLRRRQLEPLRHLGAPDPEMEPRPGVSMI